MSQNINYLENIKVLRNKYIDEQIPFIDFWHGDPEMKLSKYNLKSILETIQEGNYKYSKPRGNIELITFLAKKHSINPDNIIIGGGAKFIFYSLTQVLFKQDDEILIIAPAWSGYKNILNFLKFKYSFFRLENDDFSLNISKLEETLKDNHKIKGLIINNPNNPSGKVFRYEELNNLLTICQKYKIKVISDEVFSDLIFGQNKFFSLTKLIQSNKQDISNIFIINSASKNFGMTGYRIGYLIADKTFIKDLVQFYDLTITVPEFIQKAFLSELRDLENHRKNILTLKKKYNLVANSIKRSRNLTLDIEGGGLTIFPKIKGISNVDKLTYDLLKKAKVSVIPGSAFSYKDNIRICFSHLSDKSISEGIKALDHFIDNYKLRKNASTNS